jgi:hypothetical protein
MIYGMAVGGDLGVKRVVELLRGTHLPAHNTHTRAHVPARTPTVIAGCLLRRAPAGLAYAPAQLAYYVWDRATDELKTVMQLAGAQSTEQVAAAPSHRPARPRLITAAFALTDRSLLRIPARRYRHHRPEMER